MKYITFADGTQAPCYMLVEMPAHSAVFVGLQGLTYLEAAQIMADPSKTRTMSNGEFTVQGYTHVDYLMQEIGGIKAQMSKERS